MADYPRRDFLKLAAQGLLAVSGLFGLGGLLRFLSFSTEAPPQTEFDLGPAADYPLGSRTILPEVPALLLHDDAGFSALSLVCPHLGCTVERSDAGFTCPCHGSRFDPTGNALRGPAKQGLAALRVELTDEDRLRLTLT